MLEIPHVKTSTYGLRSIRYYAPNAWNDLTDDIRKSDTLDLDRLTLLMISESLIRLQLLNEIS